MLVFLFLHSFANANVLLVLGELMGGEGEDGGASQAAIPLIAGAIVLAQVTMVGVEEAFLVKMCPNLSNYGLSPAAHFMFH